MRFTAKSCRPKRWLQKSHDSTTPMLANSAADTEMILMAAGIEPLRNCYNLPDEEVAALKKKVESATGTGRWWEGSDSVARSPDQWKTIFHENRYHCAYCRKDLTATVADLANSSVDHIVPQWLFEPRSRANRRPNLVPACGSCNSVKGPWAPSISDDAWTSRRKFVRAARVFIEAARAEKYAAYGHLVGEGAKHVKIWDPDDDLA